MAKCLTMEPIYLNKANLQRFLSAGLLLLSLAWSGNKGLGAQPPHLLAAEIDSLIAEVLKPVRDQGPGVAVYLHRKGYAPYQQISGMANLEYGVPLTEQSIFDLASVAKQFTGMAIAKLIQAGKVSLTDDVRKYLPEVPDFGTPITLAHLIHHTSGLRDVGELNRIGNFGGEFTAATALRIVSRQQALNFAPGTKHDYSNTGYVLLALVVERVTGESFVDWCEQNIFAPLKMDHSFANDYPDRIIPNRAVAYYGTDQEFSFSQNNGMSLIGSSAVFASLHDMIKWMALFSGQHKELLEMMTTPGQLNDGSTVNYGFGLSLSMVGDRQLIAHSGSTPAGFRTLMAHLPKEELSIVILSNWGNLEPIQQLAMPIISLLLDKTNASPQKPEPVATKPVPEEILDTYTGNYLFNKEREVTIALQEGQLMVTIAGMGVAALEPRSFTEFYLPPMNSTLTFEATEQKVSRVVIREGGQGVGELTPVGQSQLFNLPTAAAGSFYSEELDQHLTLEQKDNVLYLISAAYGTSPLRQISPLTFTGPTGLFEKLNIEKSLAGDITGFTLDLGSRARRLRFQRWHSFTSKTN